MDSIVILVNEASVSDITLILFTLLQEKLDLSPRVDAAYKEVSNYQDLLLLGEETTCVLVGPGLSAQVELTAAPGETVVWSFDWAPGAGGPPTDGLAFRVSRDKAALRRDGRPGQVRLDEADHRTREGAEAGGVGARALRPVARNAPDAAGETAGSRAQSAGAEPRPVPHHSTGARVDHSGHAAQHPRRGAEPARAKCPGQGRRWREARHQRGVDFQSAQGDEGGAREAGVERRYRLTPVAAANEDSPVFPTEQHRL